MRGNRWSHTPAYRARPNRCCAWPEAPTGGGVPVVTVERVQVRDAGVLAGHGGVTAGATSAEPVLAGGRSRARSTSLVSIEVVAAPIGS